MKRDLEEALAFLFPTREAEVQALLAPLVSDRVRWAVLAVSRGDESELLRCVIDAERDWRDVLQAESMSDEPRGSLIRALPRPEELAFRLHARELTRLGFFDRIVLSGAVAFDPPKEPLGVVEALTARMASSFGSAKWNEVSLDQARFLLSHIMRRGFSPKEEVKAPQLLAEFESFARAERAFVACDPDPPPITPDGKADRSRRPLNCRIGVVLLSAARAWGLWMTHAAE
jgi:hypothetical protein